MSLSTMTAQSKFRGKQRVFNLFDKDPFYSESNQAYLMKSIIELREGKGQAHELIEVED